MATGARGKTFAATVWAFASAGSLKSTLITALPVWPGALLGVPNAPVATPRSIGRPVFPVLVVGVPKLPNAAGAGVRFVELVCACTGTPLGSPKEPVRTGFAIGIAGISAGILG